MYVIGTAGHVDHGKSTLVAALTGTHPDRLKEEQAREMTIELGFAWFNLPDGQPVGVVDVPGHRDFIENMLAGVGGIDAVIFVIAADEGVMPQTREHLAILDLLQINGGVIALTKCDMVDDPDWLDMIEEDVKKVTAGTVLAEAEIIRVSARMKTGLDDLVKSLTQVLSTTPPRVESGKPRLPIDRVFTIQGFGTVVTGTLIDGSIKTGDEIVILPTGITTRVRGLQTHKSLEDTASSGQRTAINLGGVSIDQVGRGDVVVKPGTYHPTARFDAQIRLIKEMHGTIRHQSELKLFLGAKETLAHIRLLDAEELKAGMTAFVQLETVDEIVARKGDRFVLRRPSPGETVGGGQIIDPHPGRRHKRMNGDILSGLQTRMEGTPEERLIHLLQGKRHLTLTELLAQSGIPQPELIEILNQLEEVQQVVTIKTGNGNDNLIYLSVSDLNAIQIDIHEIVKQYHQAFPLRLGIPREELKTRLKLPAKVFNTMLERLLAAGEMHEKNHQLALSGHTLIFSAAQKQSIELLLGKFIQDPVSTPAVKECITSVGEPVYQALILTDELVQVSEDVVYRPIDLEKMMDTVTSYLKLHETITLAECRDIFGTSRKYIQALLEYMDRIGLTKRDGDVRRLKGLN